MPPKSSLLQWLATFELAGEPAIELNDDAYYNLADGFVCARILNQISPKYFTDKWLEGIKPVAPNGSWRLRVSNLKRILQKIHDYASDLQSSQSMLDAINPDVTDVTVIAQNFDADQIDRLIRLILFCAINCWKPDYNEKISVLPTQVKQDIKEAIEELLVKNKSDNQQQQLEINPSQLANESISAHGDDNSRNTSQRFNISSTSSNFFNSPARSVNRQVVRRDSSQSDQYKRNELSHLDISSQSIQIVPNENLESVSRRLSEALKALKVADQRAQSCHELEVKLKQVELERNQLQYENERLISERSAASPKVTSNLRRKSSTFRDQDAGRIQGEESGTKAQSGPEIIDELQGSRDLIRVQAEVQRLKKELNRVETEKEDYRLKSNLLTEDLDRITLKHEQLKSKAEQAKRLQDELDEHKHINEKVISCETKVQNLVIKNNELRREIKSLEEKNLGHIQRIVRLEQDNQQLENSVGEVEIYKQQLSDAHAKLSRETHRADKAEVDLVRLTEKLDATKKENEKLFETTNQLMRSSTLKDNQSDIYALNRPFESVNLKDGPTAEVNRGLLRGDNALDSISTPVIELKERLARLEMENQLLEAKVNSKADMTKSVLSGLLEEATDKCKRLEDDNRQLRKKMLVLESNLKELTLDGQPSTSGPMPIQDSSSDNVLALIKRVEDLQRSLYQREQELRDAEARYKKNISKAKGVIKALNNNQSMNSSVHPSCMSSVSLNQSSLDETNVLRQQLREREERTIELEREFHEFKKLKEVHERLILSAFYGLTTPMQWKNAERRLEQRTLTSPTNIASAQLSKNQ